MSRIAAFVAFALAALAVSSTLIAGDAESPAGPRLLRIAEHRDRAVPVAAWDPYSPQRLVRIDGALYQEGAGSYFPVIAGQITVALRDGVDSWDELVAAAVALDAETYGTLEQLEAFLRTLGFTEVVILVQGE